MHERPLSNERLIKVIAVTNPTSKPTRVLDRSISRRQLLVGGASAAVGAAILGPRLSLAQAVRPERKMKLCLTPGSIGVDAGQIEAIELAERHGFEAVEPFGGYLASLSDEQIGEVVGRLKEKGLVWGAAGLPVDFRGDRATFEEGLKELPTIAAALQKAGAARVGTWLMPGHDALTYIQNLKQHAERLRKVTEVLAEHGQRLGLEYVGTHSLQSRFKYPFVHSLAETLDLISEIGTGNVGFVLDSWHWWQAGDTAEEIISLENRQVVSVDLNDAPQGIPKHEQIDGQRELPAATGVIDVRAFLAALAKIGYDGPVRPEPFNRELRALDNDAACSATIRAMRTAMDSVF